MIVLFAPHIHTGGGQVLLNAVLSNVHFDMVAFVDHRFTIDPRLMDKQIHFVKIRANLMSRLWAEYLLLRMAKGAESVFCFSSLPPLFRLKCPVTVFFQNNILLNQFSHFKFSRITRIKHSVERLWLQTFLSNADRFVVQTEVTKEYFLRDYRARAVEVAPFLSHEAFDQLPPKRDPEFDFIYVASSDPHKNHTKLLAAWWSMADKGVFPSLVLTLSEASVELLSEVARLKSLGIRIYNFPNLSHERVLELYCKCSCLIFPSLAESLGLPLYEAAYLGLDVGASDLNYVHEVVKPDFVFNPMSSESIAGAVIAYLEYKRGQLPGGAFGAVAGREKVRLSVLSEADFIRKYMGNRYEA